MIPEKVNLIHGLLRLEYPSHVDVTELLEAIQHCIILRFKNSEDRKDFVVRGEQSRKSRNGVVNTPPSLHDLFAAGRIRQMKEVTGEMANDRYLQIFSQGKVLDVIRSAGLDRGLSVPFRSGATIVDTETCSRREPCQQ